MDGWSIGRLVDRLPQELSSMVGWDLQSNIIIRSSLLSVSLTRSLIEILSLNISSVFSLIGVFPFSFFPLARLKRSKERRRFARWWISRFSWFTRRRRWRTSTGRFAKAPAPASILTLPHAANSPAAVPTRLDPTLSFTNRRIPFPTLIGIGTLWGKCFPVFRLCGTVFKI